MEGGKGGRNGGSVIESTIKKSLTLSLMCKIIECNLQALLRVFCWLSFAFPDLTCQPVMVITEKQLSVEWRQCGAAC